MAMKAGLRSLARTVAGWPVVGRFARIGVAVVRSPERHAGAVDAQARLEHRLDALEARFKALDAQLTSQLLPGLTRLAGLETRQAAFETTQLPRLLETLSEMNNRLVARTSAMDNLVQSVPVALRNATRDAVEQRRRIELLEETLSSTKKAIDAFGQSSAGDATSPAAASRVEGIAASVQYLLGRVEFVRRELMFEMRYGASTGTPVTDGLRARTEILDEAKVDAARRDGIRVNLGCGHVPLDGYLNVDRRALPGVDIVAEVDDLPFASGEISEIFSAHLLEHFPQEQLKRELLGYWRGLLKPGGTFAAVVPDGDGMAKAYLDGEYDFEQFRSVTFGGQDYDGDFHYNMLSPSSLSALLGDAGFGSVEVVAANRENGGCKELEIRAVRA